MVALCLVRHGQTDWNVEGRWEGQANPPLNAVGRVQAEALAIQLVDRSFVGLYSSDLLRARETAEILGRKFGLPVHLDTRLREIHQGEWEGKLGAEVTELYPEAWAFHAPGGESVAEVAMRVWAAADEISTRHPAGQVLVVSHGLALATLICRRRSLPLVQAPELIPIKAYPEMIEWPSGCGSH